MDTNIIHATEDFLKSEIEKRNERITQLEEHIQRLTQRDYSTAAALQAMRDGLQEWTMENFENGNITEEQATELSEMGGFDLTKEVEVEVNVTYYITLQLPAGEDAESAINDIDFEAISYDSDTITHISASVDNIDI
jgi:polyhydroxyalkanoate synthesis regulator phasin